VPDVRDRLAGTGWDTCVVVNDERVVLGRLGRRALREAAGSVEDAMTPGPGTVRPNLALAALSERMERQNLTSVIVTTSNGRLVGVVRRST
jgi:CBS domain-containing protein